MRRYKLVCPSSDDLVFDVPENEGFSRSEIIRLIEDHTPDGGFEVVDGSALTPDERETIYITEAIAAAGNRYRIRRVFGSNSAGRRPILRHKRARAGRVARRSTCRRLSERVEGRSLSDDSRLPRICVDLRPPATRQPNLRLPSAVVCTAVKVAFPRRFRLGH